MPFWTYEYACTHDTHTYKFTSETNTHVMGKSGDAVVSVGADKRVLPDAEGKKKTKKKNKKEKTHSSGSYSS